MPKAKKMPALELAQKGDSASAIADTTMEAAGSLSEKALALLSEIFIQSKSGLTFQVGAAGVILEIQEWLRSQIKLSK